MVPTWSFQEHTWWFPSKMPSPREGIFSGNHFVYDRGMSLVRKALLISAAVIFALAHLFFLKTFFYWEYEYLDLAMHVAGGLLIVALWYEFFTFFRSNRYTPLFVLVTVIVSWEIFKYLIGSTVQSNYAIDTVTDVLAGLCGGLASFLFYRSRTIQSS